MAEKAEPFFEQLNSKLEVLGFEKSQIENIKASIVETSRELANKESETQKATIDANAKNTEDMLKIVIELVKNPEVIKGIFKRNNWIKYVFDFSIAFVVIFALVYLSANGLIEKNQAGTILGGIVGYLLGNSSK